MLLFFCHSFFICIQGSCFPWPKYKVTLKLLQRLFSHPRPTSDKNRESCSNRDSFIRLLKKAHNLKLLSLLFPPETEFPNLCESVNKGSSQKHTFFPLMVSTTKVRLTCELTCTQRGDQTLKHSIKFIFKILEVKMGQQFKKRILGATESNEHSVTSLSSVFSWEDWRLSSGLERPSLLWGWQLSSGKALVDGMCECHWSKQGMLSCAKDHFKSILSPGEKEFAIK